MSTEEEKTLRERLTALVMLANATMRECSSLQRALELDSSILPGNREVLAKMVRGLGTQSAAALMVITHLYPDVINLFL